MRHVWAINRSRTRICSSCKKYCNYPNRHYWLVLVIRYPSAEDMYEPHDKKFLISGEAQNRLVRARMNHRQHRSSHLFRKYLWEYNLSPHFSNRISGAFWQKLRLEILVGWYTVTSSSLSISTFSTYVSSPHFKWLLLNKESSRR